MIIDMLICPFYGRLGPQIFYRHGLHKNLSNNTIISINMLGIVSPLSCDEKDMACIVKVTFGTLFNDDECANIFEALVGTLRAAKKRKVVTYDGELLLQGVHDNVEITLKPSPADVEAAN